MVIDASLGWSMKRFVEGEDGRQGVLLPAFLDDWVSEENPDRAIDVFVDELDLAALRFERVEPAATGRPGYHPAVLLKLYVYGYLNQIASSRLDQVEASIARYLAALETADRQEGELAKAKSERLAEKIARLHEQMAQFKALEPVAGRPDRFTLLPRFV